MNSIFIYPIRTIIDKDTTTFVISGISLVISIIAFFYPIFLRFWIEKPKLTIFLRKIKVKEDKQSSDKIEKVQLLLFNEGHRPMIISNVLYEGKKGKSIGNMGIYDEGRLSYDGVPIRVLPRLLKSGDSFEYNLFSYEAMKKVKTIHILDSYGKDYDIKEKELNNFLKYGSCNLSVFPKMSRFIKLVNWFRRRN